MFHPITAFPIPFPPKRLTPKMATAVLVQTKKPSTFYMPYS
jgi:hypothetical protein